MQLAEAVLVRMIGLHVGVEGGGGVALELDLIPGPLEEAEGENDGYKAGLLDESRDSGLPELSRYEVNSFSQYCAVQ